MIYNKGTFAKWQISSVTEKHLFWSWKQHVYPLHYNSR
jgi:hypothetical protein